MSRSVLRPAHLTTAMVAVVLTTFGLAGCGDDDSAGSAAAPPASTPVTTTATTPTQTTPEDATDDTGSKSKQPAAGSDSSKDSGTKESTGDEAASGKPTDTKPANDRVKQVTAALKAAGFKVETAPVVQPAAAVLKVNDISVVFYKTSAAAKADSKQFQALFQQKPDQGMVRQEGRRVYFVTAAGPKLTAEQRANYAKVVKLSEDAQK